MRPGRLLSFSARNAARRPLRSAIGVGLVAAGVTAVLLVWGVIAGQRRALMGQAAETVFGGLQVHAKGYAQASDVLPVRPALDDAEGWRQKALAVPGVRAASARLKLGAMLSAPDARGGASATVTVVAFDEAQERAVAPGRFALIEQGAFANGAVLGAPLARALKLEADDAPALLSRDADGLLNGIPLNVGGLAVPLLPTDRAAVWVTLREARELVRLGAACNELALAVDDLDGVDGLRARVQDALGPSVEVETWKQQLPVLADMVSNMRLSGLIVSLIIALVSAVGVFTCAALNVRDRTREIGTWLALGVRRRSVWGAFVAESALLGAAGAAVGLALGLAAALVVTRWGIPMKLPGTTVFVDVTPSLRAGEVTLVLALAVAVSMAGAFVPALRAARLEPVKALGDA
ncbi:MAG: ABC transporter permease [Myxococcaceae bacterium]|nr:ABC transporter permease [Myxococcaceae bacterium]